MLAELGGPSLRRLAAALLPATEAAAAAEDEEEDDDEEDDANAHAADADADADAALGLGALRAARRAAHGIEAELAAALPAARALLRLPRLAWSHRPAGEEYVLEVPRSSPAVQAVPAEANPSPHLSPSASPSASASPSPSPSPSPNRMQAVPADWCRVGQTRHALYFRPAAAEVLPNPNPDPNPNPIPNPDPTPTPTPTPISSPNSIPHPTHKPNQVLLRRLLLMRERREAAAELAWTRVLAALRADASALGGIVRRMASLDCLQALAALAASPGYCAPTLLPDEHPATIDIRGGRHPLVAARLAGRGAAFVPNDTALGGSGGDGGGGGDSDGGGGGEGRQTPANPWK